MLIEPAGMSMFFEPASTMRHRGDASTLQLYAIFTHWTDSSFYYLSDLVILLYLSGQSLMYIYIQVMSKKETPYHSNGNELYKLLYKGYYCNYDS